ncbi:MAG: DeoR/GlpR family DNA-binding transcription regulator [Deinococcales bacterium]
MYSLNERQFIILERLEAMQRVQVSELAEHFAVSEVTIRKDLQELEERSLLKRVHGGAVATRRSKYNPALSFRPMSQAKINIAKAATQLIHDGDTLILDAGSTTLALAQLLNQQFRGLTIITNSLAIINELAGGDFELFSLGGEVRQHSHAFIGPLTVHSLSKVHADTVFLGATSLNLEKGLGTPNLSEAETKAAMIRAASQRVALADSSKLGQASLATFAHWDEIHTLVCDKDVDKVFKEGLKLHRVELIIASQEHLSTMRQVRD